MFAAPATWGRYNNVTDFSDLGVMMRAPLPPPEETRRRLRPAFRMRRRPGLGALGAALALVSFAVFRIAIETGIRGDGRVTTGMLSSDSYYPLSFARELEREGRWLLFQNPFGSSDNSPGLYDGVAVLLRLIGPLWQRHLFAFDLVVCGASALVAGYFFGRVLESVSRQDRQLTAACLVFVIFGTGVAFITHKLGLGPRRVGLQWGSQWGVSWFHTQLATWEMLYHALFWTGAFAIVTRRVRAAWAIGVVLFLLHPFTLGIYVLFAGATWTAHRFIRHVDERTQLRIFLPLLGLAIAGALVYEVLLPALSTDAEYFKKAYDVQPFAIPTGDLLLFIAPALLVFTALAVAARQAPWVRDDTSPWPFTFISFAAVLLIIAVSRHVTTAIPQPAHWTRVYLVAALVLGGVSLPSLQAQRRKAGATAVIALAAVAIADSALSIGPIRNDLLQFAAPAVLDESEAAVVETLRDRPSALAVYLRDCEGRDYVPALEYTLSALTDQRVVYGHAYFSPDLNRRTRLLAACPNQPRPTFPPGTYVISDPGISRSLPLSDRREIGRFDFGVLQR